MELDRCARELAKESQRRAAVNSDTAEVHPDPKTYTLNPNCVWSGLLCCVKEASPHSTMNCASLHTIVKASPNATTACVIVNESQRRAAVNSDTAEVHHDFPSPF